MPKGLLLEEVRETHDSRSFEEIRISGELKHLSMEGGDTDG